MAILAVNAGSSTLKFSLHPLHAGEVQPSVLTGKLIPAKPLEVLAPEVLKKFGIQVGQSRQTRDYNAGASTQLPSGIVLNTGKRRIQRKLGFNGKLVQYERT